MFVLYVLSLLHYKKQRNVLDIKNGDDQSFEISFGGSNVLYIDYWESCDSATKFYKMKEIQESLSKFNFNFLLALIVISVITILIVCILSFFTFKHGDPINYYAIVWMVLELWDFESDIGFTIYLWYFYKIYGIHDDQLRLESILLFIAAAFFVIIPYFSNLSYLNNLITMWTQKTSAGICIYFESMKYNEK